MPQLRRLVEPAGGDQRETQPAAGVERHVVHQAPHLGGHLVDVPARLLRHLERVDQVEVAGLTALAADVAGLVRQPGRLLVVAPAELLGGVGQQQQRLPVRAEALGQGFGQRDLVVQLGEAAQGGERVHPPPAAPRLVLEVRRAAAEVDRLPGQDEALLGVGVGDQLADPGLQVEKGRLGIGVVEGGRVGLRRGEGVEGGVELRAYP
ncbi:hypothetical protein AB0M20_06435 [Actinoplanes sp. NPDC051633]|uniref:hypothetical protein n=1 Tax=Actinoplanes sp. NPDC051633 TaxID=3155670 RepID=UPI003422B38F